MQCPCSPHTLYENCCQLLHLGAAADSPERLMRARFSAFALNLQQYLEQTWHPSTRPQLALNDNPEWVQLQILASSQKSNKGMVHFRAFYKHHKELGMMEEKSDFIFEQGQWLYVQGEVLA